eukprot:Stramenopile-MAST_4_protein_2484
MSFGRRGFGGKGVNLGKQILLPSASEPKSGDGTSNESTSAHKEKNDSSVGGSSGDGGKMLVPVVLSKLTCFVPNPDSNDREEKYSRGELKVYSYNQIQKRMKDQQHRKFRAELEYVKMNQKKNLDAGTVELDIAEEDDLNTAPARNSPLGDNQTWVRRHCESGHLKLFCDGRNKDDRDDSVERSETLAGHEDEDENGEASFYGIQCRSWEDSVIWGVDDEDEDKHNDVHKDDVDMIATEKEEGKTGSLDRESGRNSSEPKEGFNTAARGRQRLVPCLGVNKDLNNPEWLKEIIWDDTSDEAILKRAVPLRIDFTDTHIISKHPKKLKLMSYADHIVRRNNIRGELSVAAGVACKNEAEEDSLKVDFDGGFANTGDKNKVYKALAEVYCPSTLWGQKKRGHFSFKKVNFLPIQHSKVTFKFLSYFPDPLTFFSRVPVPLNKMREKALRSHKVAMIEIRSGRRFEMPMEEASTSGKDILFANSMQQGEILLFEYLEENPLLLNLPGMGATMVHYDMRGETESSEAREDDEVLAKDFGHSVKITDENVDAYPLLGSKNTLTGVDSVLWTNLFRSRCVLQKHSKTNFLVSLRTKPNSSGSRKLMRSMNIWPMPPLFAVGQQENVRSPGAGGSQLSSFRKLFFKYQLLKKIKLRRENPDAYDGEPDTLTEDDLKMDFPVSSKQHLFAFKEAKRQVFESTSASKRLKQEFKGDLLDESLRAIEKTLSLEELAMHKADIEANSRYEALSMMSPEFRDQFTTRNRHTSPLNVMAILDPEKGPLRILMNIQQRRENRKAHLVAEWQKYRRRNGGYYDLILYERRLTKVNEALERGQKEIDCVKMFAACLQNHPEKLMNNFFHCHVWARRKTPKKPLRIRLDGPGNPFGHTNAGFSYMVDEDDGDGDDDDEDEGSSGKGGAGSSSSRTKSQKGTASGSRQTVRAMREMPMRELRQILVSGFGQDAEELKEKTRDVLMKMIQKKRQEVAEEDENVPDHLERKEKIERVVENQRRILKGDFTVENTSDSIESDWTGLKPMKNMEVGIDEEKKVMQILHDLWHDHNCKMKPKEPERNSQRARATSKNRPETKSMKKTAKVVRVMKTIYDESGQVKKCTVSFRKATAADEEDLNDTGRERRRKDLLQYKLGMNLKYKKKNLLKFSATASRSKISASRDGSAERGASSSRSTVLKFKGRKSASRSQAEVLPSLALTFSSTGKKKNKLVSSGKVNNEYERSYSIDAKRRKITDSDDLNTQLKNVVDQLCKEKSEFVGPPFPGDLQTWFWHPVIITFPDIKRQYLQTLKDNGLKASDLKSISTKCTTKGYTSKEEFLSDTNMIALAAECFNKGEENKNIVSAGKYLAKRAEELVNEVKSTNHA